MKDITFFKVDTVYSCGLWCCKRKSVWGIVRRNEDKSVDRNYSCDEHLMANLRATIEKGMPIWKEYWKRNLSI